MAALTRLLRLGAGLHPRRGGAPHRTYPSAGAMHPLEVYVATGPLEGLGPGLWHLQPGEDALAALQRDDVRRDLAETAASTELATAGALIVITGVLWRTARRYGPRGWRHLFWDAGALLANLWALATASGVDAELHVAFADPGVEALLGLEASAETALAMFAVGRADPAPVGNVGEEPPASAPPVAPAAPRFPRVEEAIVSSSLGDSGDVRAWRRAAAALMRDTEAPALDAERKLPGGSIEQVILRRGSTRQFAAEAVPAVELELGLQTALAQPAGDLPPLLSGSALVSAVQGLAPGAYSFTRGLTLVRDGLTRNEVAHLCLDQPLAGEAAAVVVFTADLDTVLATLGERGYRAAQLAAGVALGRAYLAAYAMGLGATGLTFYDDDLGNALGGGREPLTCVALGIDARRPGLRTRGAKLQ